MFSKHLTLPAFVALVCAQFAAAAPLKDKFSTLVSNIEREIKTYGGEPSRLDALSSGSVRQFLFTIETMSEIYSSRYQGLAQVYKTTKGLEDQIGGYRKSLEQLSAAKARGATKEKIQQLEAASKRTGEALVDFLKPWVDESNQGTIAQLTAAITKTAWHSEAADRAYTYGALGQQVKTIDQTAWDMARLEGGGIHDLRKAVRWYKLEMDALNDITGVHQKSCGKGPVLPTDPASGGKCLVSNCLHAHMLNLYNIFGQIKDAGEAAEAVGEHLEQKYFDQAAQLYRETKDQKIFQLLSEEFSACAK